MQKIVKKEKKGQNKVEEVMHKFENGTLKDNAGNIVTDRNKALALALSCAGLSNKSLAKAEIRNSLLMYRKQLQHMLYKEEMNDKTIHAEILKLFRQQPNVSDIDVHKLSERLGISPHIIEGHIYKILKSFVSGGTSKGDENPVNPDELEMGIEIEKEHTADPEIAEKIARDHLSEIPDYYTRLKKMEEEAGIENKKEEKEKNNE